MPLAMYQFTVWYTWYRQVMWLLSAFSAGDGISYPTRTIDLDSDGLLADRQRWMEEGGESDGGGTLINCWINWLLFVAFRQYFSHFCRDLLHLTQLSQQSSAVLRSAKRTPANIHRLNNISDVIFYCSVGERSRALALLNAALVLQMCIMQWVLHILMKSLNK